jgi:hypothetical protein
VDVGDAVAYVGAEDGEHEVYRGHPGRVIDAGLMPHDLAVSFVNGPSICLGPEDLRELSEADYLARGRRLVRLLHPLEERPVPRFNAAGDEWPDGGEPGGP